MNYNTLVAKCGGQASYIKRLKAEVERLQWNNDKAAIMIGCADEESQKLRQENAALRKRLSDIAQLLDSFAQGCDNFDLLSEAERKAKGGE